MDLIELKEMEFDIILGMNWLSTYRVSVDYYEKKVTFKIDEVSEFTIEGIHDGHRTPIISAIRATRLLRQGCQRFLATTLKKDGVKTKI